MIDIGAKVYRLAMSSYVYRELGAGEYEWISNNPGKSAEFVKLEDYEIALKRILELEGDTEWEVV